jgi:PAS domain S-box-containing protein
MPKTKPGPTRNQRQLRQLISRLSDGVILVDLDQTILWANGPALSMHGVKTVEDLGTDVDDYRQRYRLCYRNKHRLKKNDIPITKVLAGEAAQDVTVEVYRPDDPDDCRVHTIRCLVITDDGGEPDYLVLIIEDETDRYQAVERFESAFNANPAPAVICRVDDLIYVRANRGFIEMTGYAKSAIVGQRERDLDLLSNAPGRDEVFRNLEEGRTISQMETDLPTADGGTRRVIVAGQPIEIGDEKCILFTFADLEARQVAETALRQSEERFSKAFTLSPVAIAISRADDHQFIEVNQAFALLTSYPVDQVVGRSAQDLRLWGEDAEGRFRSALSDFGKVSAMDVALRAKDGTTLDCLITAEAITIGEMACTLSVLQDITDRKRSETELIAAIETVMSETSWFSRKIVEKLAGLRQTSTSAKGGVDLDTLSDRECDVLGLICEGMSDKEMAEILHLSPHTVRNHVSSLYSKIGVGTRGATLVWARERGITGRLSSSAGRPKKGQ